MNSSTSSYNGYARSCNFQYLKLKCNCNRFAEVKIANTTRNPLKLFYSCKEGRCGFLDWAHPIGCGCNHTYNAENVGVIDDIIDGNKVIDSVVERIVPVEDRVEEIAVGMGEIKTLIRHAKLMFVTMTLVFAAFFFVLVIWSPCLIFNSAASMKLFVKTCFSIHVSWCSLLAFCLLMNVTFTQIFAF